MLFRATILPAIQDPESYNMDVLYANKMISAIWKTMSPDDKAPYKAYADSLAEKMRNKTYDRDAENAARQEASRLPPGTTGFDVVPAPLVLELMRAIVRCSTDPVAFPAPLVATRDDRRWFEEKNPTLAKTMHALRLDVFQQWSKNAGDEVVLPPVFEDWEVLVTDENLAPFLRDRA